MVSPDRPQPLPHVRLRRARRLKRFSILRLAFLLLVYGLSFAAATAYFVVDTINQDLPQDLTQLLDYRPYRKSVVLANDGDEVGTFSIGSESLLTAIDERAPRLCVYGHAHDGYGLRHRGASALINAAYCGADYRPAHQPVVFELG